MSKYIIFITLLIFCMSNLGYSQKTTDEKTEKNNSQINSINKKNITDQSLKNKNTVIENKINNSSKKSLDNKLDDLDKKLQENKNIQDKAETQFQGANNKQNQLQQKQSEIYVLKMNRGIPERPLKKAYKNS